MTRTIMCRKYKEELPALERAPFPGAKGQDIFDHVSAKAWAAGLTADNIPTLVQQVMAAVQPNDTIVCMSNGGFGGVHTQLLAALAEKFSAQ